MTPSEFHDAARAYRAATQASVTSAGRTLKHNAAIGGVADSAHLIDCAEDVVYDDPLTPKLKAFREALAARLGLMIIHEGDHDHLQPSR